MVNSKINRGEIWWVNWSPGRGSEQAGRRPAVVVQTDPANHNPRYPNVVVVALSTKGREVPFHIRVDSTEENGLSQTSYVKCDQILTISKERLEQRLGSLHPVSIRKVNQALALVLDLSGS